MTFELSYLFGVSLLYLLVLFLLAYATDRGWLPQRLVRHPLIYSLSLGVYLTSWSYYGSVGFADQQGFLFLTIYFGPTLAFILAPILLAPILRLTRTYQLTSVADLFAFRYNSQVAGILVTLFTLAGTLPYIALQIRAVSESMQVLTNQATPNEMGLAFCVTLTIFAILFGARHISPREKHAGLVVAIAFESLVKLAALLCVALFALFGVFGGPSGLDQWLQANPQAVEALYEPVKDAPWLTFILLSFAAAFLLPRQFHMGFVENLDRRSIHSASWVFPLLLVLFNLAIPPILWGGYALESQPNAEYYGLSIALSSQTPLLPTIAFIGGISAASAMVIVSSLALAAMALNHLLLPASYPDPSVDMYRWLTWGRRTIIGIIILTGYGLYLVLERSGGLVQLGLVSFVAVAQFLPGMVGVLFWQRATKAGFLAGLIAGGLVWYTSLLMPLLQRSGFIMSQFDLRQFMGAMDQDRWEFATFWSLSLNTLLFVAVSLATRQDRGEQRAVAACFQDQLSMPNRPSVRARSVEDFTQQLSRIIGEPAGENEVHKALSDLKLSPTEDRPRELERLGERLERNLSGMLGPVMARMIVDVRLQMDEGAQTMLADQMRFVEERLALSRTRLRGLALELDSLRRYHQQILQDLPMGACALASDGEILNWNQAMVRLSGIDERSVLGNRVRELGSPWSELLGNFISGDNAHEHKQQIVVDGKPRWFSLHKAATAAAPSVQKEDLVSPWGGVVILVEDLTEVQTLEQELIHSERLASIGRLAAGVAHEIGNPVTGIACITQNLKYERDPEILEESIAEILEQTRRISDIVQSLSTFSHSGLPAGNRVTSFPIDECIEDARRLVQLSRDGRDIEYRNLGPAALTIEGDRQRLLQVFVNLLSNATDATEKDGKVQITTQVVGSTLRVMVTDEGRGMPETVRERILEPFFTTKEPGRGTGLGLPLANNIVRDHGGTLEVASRQDHGTRVTVRLPIRQDALSVGAARPAGN